jgi:hypothetical protein
VEDDEYANAAIARARRKIEDLRSGRAVPAPAGPFWGRIASGTVMLLVAAALVLAIVAVAQAVVWRGAIFIGVVLGVIALMCLLHGVFRVCFATASSPENAVLLFFPAVCAGSFMNARRLVVPNDFDDFPRRFPLHPVLGPGGEMQIEWPDDFDEYWNALVRYYYAPYCIAEPRDFRARSVAPDLAIVDCQLTVKMNTLAWYLLNLAGVGYLLTVWIDVKTRKEATFAMRKVLYRVGAEWHLLNGEWQGPEERDTAWIEDLASPGTPA